MLSYIVTGATTTGYNGVYNPAGVYAGTEYYALDGSHVLCIGGGEWCLCSDPASFGFTAYYYFTTVSTTPPTGTYSPRNGTGTPDVEIYTPVHLGDMFLGS